MNLLNKDEIVNLCIPKGTLTDKERQIINNHVVMTIKMLEKLPYPKKLRRVAEYAGGHHEKLDGTGYPNGLADDQLSPQARIMALADIFEALTARDRPYKKGKTLSEAMRTMGFMAKDRHIDPELFRIFVKEKLYLKYAKEYMNPSHIDDVDPNIGQ
jgi:HD-GYP domain-containing protein (c-di-GMP phosphodiesterase class II)